MNRNLFKPLDETDLVDLQVSELTSIPPGSNPFTYDSNRSGINLPKGWVVMFEMSKPGALEDLVLVNHFTGQRLKIDLTARYPRLADVIESDEHSHVRNISGRLYLPEISDTHITWHCVDETNAPGRLDDLYTLWWTNHGGLLYVRAKLFVDKDNFVLALKELADEKFDPNHLYQDDASYVKGFFAKHGPGPSPATAPNITAKPFGLDE